jgi:hypothetical protein
LGDAARASAEADVMKMRKELVAAADSSTATAQFREMRLSKETLQAQIDGERQRLQQLEHDHHQLQQQEHHLQVKIASIVEAAMKKDMEHAAALSELQQQLKVQSSEMKTEGSGSRLNRMASVERSLSEGELAQQVFHFVETCII